MKRCPRCQCPHPPAAVECRSCGTPFTMAWTVTPQGRIRSGTPPPARKPPQRRAVQRGLPMWAQACLIALASAILSSLLTFALWWAFVAER